MLKNNIEIQMSENIPFPYVSYKGKKFADPHAAAKAFLLDTDKKQTDTLNIHDISDTSSIDGAGVDLNGKIWTNNYSFQDHPSLINLKTAMKDVFASIKEVMARDNMTLEQVAEKPLNVRPFYAYNGQRYENPEEALSALYNDPNKTPHQSSVMYHNRFDGGGIELAGVGPNKEVWYTQLSEYNNTPAVAAGRAIFNKMITESPVVTATNSVEVASVNKVEAFKPHFSLDGTKYESGKEAMQAFLDKPADQRFGGVMLHTRNSSGGIQMSGQADNLAKTVWVDRMGDNDSNPLVVAARKEMNAVLDAHNIKFPPMDPNIVSAPKTVEVFKPHFSLDGTKYESGKEAMQAFLDKPADQRFGGVMLHTRNSSGGIQMSGQADNLAKTVWVDRMSDNDANPVVVAARKEMNEVLDAHNIKFPPMDPNIVSAPKVVESFKPYFSLDGTKYESGKEAMQAFLDKPADQRFGGVMLHTRNSSGGIQMSGQADNLAKTVWVDRMSDNDANPVVVAARKEMNEVLDAHNFKFPPMDPYLTRAPKKVADEIEFNTVTENKQPEFPYFKYDNKVYSSANDVMKVFIADRDNGTIKSDVNLHIDNHFSSVDAAGHDRNGDIWKNQYSFQDHPAMKDFKNTFDKHVNGYKANLQYLDEVYADNAKMVEGYPREVQIADMKEMKTIIDKLPTHNVSDTDMIKITSYKNDIKNHELSVFLDDGTKNNDVKIKNTNALKIS
jgi:hypothetical protein